MSSAHSSGDVNSLSSTFFPKNPSREPPTSSFQGRTFTSNYAPRAPQRPPADPRGSSTSAQKSGYNCVSTLKWIGVAIAVTAAVVGILGLLVYLGKLSIGWQGVGNISTQMGLYGMLGGLGTAAIITILLAVSCCVSREKQNSEQQRNLLRQAQPLEI